MNIQNDQSFAQERKIVEMYIDFYNSFKIEEMVNLFTEDCSFQNISNSSECVTVIGKEELKSLATKSASFFQNRTQKVTNWILSKSKVAVEIDYTAILAIDLPNGLKKGDSVHLKGVSIYEMESGKIKRLADFS